MRDHTAPYRRARYIFSADKHWIFILLIASNFVLLSLVFTIFNQDYGLFTNKSLLQYQNISPTVSNTPIASNSAVLFSNYVDKIQADFYRIFLGLAQYTRNSQNLNEYYKEYSFEPKSTIKISATEYVVGQKYIVSSQVGTASAKKTTYEMDKFVKWLSSLDSGLQKTIVYDPSIKNPVETTVQAKKIGRFIYYVNDNISPSRTWVREYLGYDNQNKQIIHVSLLTNQKTISGQKVPEYNSDTLKIISQIESLLVSESNKMDQ